MVSLTFASLHPQAWTTPTKSPTPTSPEPAANLPIPGSPDAKPAGTPPRRQLKEDSPRDMSPLGGGTSPPTADSQRSSPAHLPDDAFYAGEAVPSQSPEPLLNKGGIKAAKNKQPKAGAARSLWGGVVGTFRRSPSPVPEAAGVIPVPMPAIAAVHLPSEAGSPEPRQVPVVVFLTFSVHFRVLVHL